MEILLMGTIRDGGSDLGRRITKIEEAFKFASRIHWVIVESDSSDGTNEVLSNIAQTRQNFRYESLGTLRDRIPLRTERLAYCRNRTLEIFRNSTSYSAVELVSVVDLDGVNDDLNEDAILSSFQRADWDCVAANQREAYFDIWALRAEDWCDGDCWKAAQFLIARGLSPQWALFSCVYSKMIEIPPDSSWIRVTSAFGGLAIYRRPSLENAFYVGLSPDGTEVCEHVALNKQICKNGGKLFINPKMINCGLNEHCLPWWDVIKLIKIIEK
jgi:hypothetical protein